VTPHGPNPDERYAPLEPIRLFEADDYGHDGPRKWAAHGDNPFEFFPLLAATGNPLDYGCQVTRLRHARLLYIAAAQAGAFQF
jgi:hypothetical protein